MALAVVCAALTSGSAGAQNSPNSFQLPTPTPTPTQAPQGPVDERAGVPIAPRVIPEDRPPPAPTPTPSPTQTTASTPAATAPSPTPSPSPSVPARSAAQPETTRTTERSSTPDTETTAPPPAAVPAESVASDTGVESDPAIGPDDWYDVDQLGTERNTPATIPETDVQSGTAASIWAETESSLTDTRNLAIGGVLLIVLLGAGLWLWRRREAAQEPLALPAPALAAGVRRSIAATKPASDSKIATPSAPISPLELTDAVPEPSPVAETPVPAASPISHPAPEPPAPEPLHVDLSLHIESASRSVMMFMIDYRLTVANRSDRAARDIEVTAHLTCAQRGGANAAPIAGGQPAEAIERIGPHQSRSIGGQLQMPLTEIHAIRQGQKPLFIPLLHLSIVSAGGHTITRSFVVGEPSSTSQGRVHPIRLDTPPGGLPGLQAREVSLETA